MHAQPQPPTPAATLEAVCVFTLAAAAPLYLALRGGAYDIIVRQQAGIVLWWGIALGYISGLLPRARPARAARLPFIALACLLAWTALSLFWTESPEQSFAELARSADYAGLVVLVLVGVSERTWKAAALGLVVAVLALPLISLASRVTPEFFPAGAPIEPLAGNRLSYPLGYWNAVGVVAAMAIGAGILLSAAATSRFWRVAALAPVPAAIAADYLTFSRTGAICGLLAAALAVGLSRHRLTAIVHASAAVLGGGAAIVAIRSEPAINAGQGAQGGAVVAMVVIWAAIACGLAAGWTSRRRLDRSQFVLPGGRAILATVAAALLVLAITLGPSLASRAGAQFEEGNTPTLALSDPAARLLTLSGPRYELWSSALRAFASSPLTGTGPGTFQFWWAREDSGPFVLDAHSLGLETAAELGLPGLFCLLLLLIGLAGLGLRAWRRLGSAREANLGAGLLAIFAVFLVAANVDWMWELTAVGAIAVAAIAIAGASLSRQTRSRRLDRPRLAMIAVAIAFGALQIPGLVATQRVRASESALRAGLLARATQLADDAVTAEPWAATPYAARATAELARGQLEQALDDARAAERHEPTNWRWPLLAARVDLERGDSVGAVRDLEQVGRLRHALASQAEAAARAVARRGASALVGSLRPTGSRPN